MHYSSALRYLKEKVSETENRNVINTLNDIYTLMLLSTLKDGKRWAAKMETVVNYVIAGNYAFCHQDARKLLNKRVYKI